MAKSFDNEVMAGASGRVGKMLVFRQRGDQTIIARKPRKRKDGKLFTDVQLQVQNRFLDASLYARKAIADPELKAAYQAKANVNQTAYNVAVKDFFTPPVVRRLDDRAYTGVVGDLLSILIKDVLMVTEVMVEILDDDGTVIESGYAESVDNQGIEWFYTATVDNEDYNTVSFRISMVDTPGNRYTEVKTFGQDTNL
ncbi:hypothetical protein GCM10023231_24620 [Olivibacter ginsenosidimutans]|uniref:Uncharacterized protein n=1 Tax=Olivibacter ginsenosidimutans TaxID=1176537 RepID=A0ABP9BJN2_9SPHI